MIKIKKFVLRSLETNCYLVYSDTSKTGFLIDPGFYDKKIQNFIDNENIQVCNIINTHGHADHIAGNKKFHYPVLIHEADTSFLKDPRKNLSFFAGMIFNSPLPERTLKDGDIIKKEDIVLEVIHTPGHTPGGICLRLLPHEANPAIAHEVIFTGDTLFMEGVGRTDFPYGNGDTLIDSIRKRLLIFEDNTEILPGHGPASTIGHERKNNPFL